ncbi:sugar ABC transporter substrate-binding protein [Acidocella sp.]|uniref:sugar ABC transporter substrate-binding protein n=1 Tax=Acidocella sp. TaxID=50710 RepID=UPI002623D095|nr:sugar ABC transporter substrate-binding protein [Acidocella sp.]
MKDDQDEDRLLAVKRRMLMKGGPALLAAAGVAAMTKNAYAAEASPFPAHKRWRLVFVNHVTTNPFFVATQYGIQDACALFGCDYQWTGSQTAVVGEMVNAMNAAIASQADAIGIAIVDPEAFNAPTAAALEAGIPVFSYNADAPADSGNKRLAYIGQDLFKSGYEMGQKVVALVGSGHVALFIATPGQLNIQPRIDGAAAAIKASGKPITYEEIATGATIDEELPKIKAYYLGHQDVKGMFAVDAGSTQCVGQVMQEFNLGAKGVHGGGFDLVPRTLQSIHEGILDFTIDQQPYLQGFYTVMEMVMYLASGGLVGPADINTGLKFVVKGNVDPYLHSSTRYEGDSAKPQIVPRSGPIGA